MMTQNHSSDWTSAIRSGTTLEEGIALLADRVRRASRITVLTGAGVSAASGVPTFRGPEGLWKDFRPEELATPEAFARDPRHVWEWYDWRRQTIAQCRPNPAHEVLAAWSRRHPSFTLVTQNVDGLHERAGTEGVLRFHGSIWEVSCARRCAGAPLRWRDETAPFPELPPPCPHCGGPLRPGVVWFGELIPQDVLEGALRAVDCDLCLVVGTSSVVYPAASLVDAARERGAFTVEINPEATPASGSCDLALAAPAEEVLPCVEELLGTGGR
jgi:NAD-dependent deacetylase